MAAQSSNIFVRIFRFYVDGFRQMTWGRTLWIIIGVKLAVMFLILRLFFFQPTLKGMTDTQKADAVGAAIEMPK